MKTTKQDFRYFKERVTHWQKELGLLDWSLWLEHKKLDGKAAETGFMDEAGVARITLSTDWEEDSVDKNGLDRTAMHECCHLLLSKLTSEAKARYATEYEIDRAEHHIIRVLENLLTGVKR